MVKVVQGQGFYWLRVAKVEDLQGQGCPRLRMLLVEYLMIRISRIEDLQDQMCLRSMVEDI